EPARRRARAQELSVRWFRRWRGSGGRVLQSDWHGQTERPGPGSVSAHGARAHRRAPDQPHRRTAAVESRKPPRRGIAPSGVAAPTGVAACPLLATYAVLIDSG